MDNFPVEDNSPETDLVEIIGSDCTIKKPKCVAIEDVERLLEEKEARHLEKKRRTLTVRQMSLGFKPHSFTSFTLAVERAEHPYHTCMCAECNMLRELECEEEETSRTVTSQTSTPATTYEEPKKRVYFLMGMDEEEADGTPEMLEAETEDEDLINGGSVAMRRAQRYLREHRIFEFFQFLIAHLLSATPLDPISFLLSLLDKCLIYRSGICDPPLLYDHRHIGALFNLMDRMRTGYIELDQYKTGMKTFGLKSYKQNPPTTVDGLVPKHFFCDEAYECLKDLLDDMIRRRTKICKKSVRVPKAPPPSQAVI